MATRMYKQQEMVNDLRDGTLRENNIVRAKNAQEHCFLGWVQYDEP